MYCAIPGDACFQCHGISACVSDPPQATLPLFIHYYGNKDSIHELDLIRSMPFLCQSLFGHEDTPRKRRETKRRQRRCCTAELTQGETRSHGAQMWNGRMESRRRP